VRGRIDLHFLIIPSQGLVATNVTCMHWLLKNLGLLASFKDCSHLLLDYLQDSIDVLHCFCIGSIADEGIHGFEYIIVAH
jgi:hypothetical protein